jgi:putative ABC transport system permease protein
MNFVALKMLLGDRMKYLSLIAGLAFASLLVTQQASIFTGYALRCGSWLRDTDVADLWVFDEQAEFSDDFKLMLDTSLNRVRGIPGVRWAQPMYKNFVNVILPDGTSINTRMIGLDDTTLLGGPPEMVTGALGDLRRDRAVFINAADASDSLQMKRNPGGPRPLRPGDRISINDHEAIVAGTYKSTKEFFWEPVIYTTFSRAIFMGPKVRRSLTYVLVKAQPGTDVTTLASRIHEKTGLSAMTRSQFERRTTLWIIKKTGILVNFGITIVLGVVIGLLAAGQTFFTFVLDNTRHFAALKAMGTTGWKLMQMVGVQVAFVGLVGYGIGLGGSCLTGLAFQRVGLAFMMPWQIPLVGAAAIILCCAFAGTISMIRVLRLEPAIVFK